MTAIPVLISLKSNAHRDEATEDESMSMLTSGKLEVDDTSAIIRYEESIDESLPPQPVEIRVEGIFGQEMYNEWLKNNLPLFILSLSFIKRKKIHTFAFHWK
jgi:hypothetical protein